MSVNSELQDTLTFCKLGLFSIILIKAESLRFWQSVKSNFIKEED